MVEQPIETPIAQVKRTVEESVNNVPAELQIVEETTEQQPVQEIISPAVAQSIYQTSKEPQQTSETQRPSRETHSQHSNKSKSEYQMLQTLLNTLLNPPQFH
jgi:hypothetical protein